MREKQNNPGLPDLIILLLAVTLFLRPAAGFGQGRRVDETTLEVDMANRLEMMLEKTVGKDRCLVQIDITLSPPPMAGVASVATFRGIPGIALPDNQTPDAAQISTAGAVTIKSVGVILYLDNKLSPDKVDLIKNSVPKWMELNFARGDSMKIELIPWRDLPPEDVAVKQLSFLKKNLWVIVAIAGTIILGFVLFLLLLLPTRKFIKDRAKIKPEEAQKMPDFNKLLEDLKEVITKPASAEGPGDMGKVLEDMKNLLAKAPSKTDDLLEEIKVTLEKMAEKQSLSTGAGGAGVAGSMANPEFINALKEAIAPAAGASAAAGPGMSPEVLATLQQIQELMKQQVEATATGSKVLDEPFKYLATLTPKEINLYIGGESPRIAATILGHMDANKAGEIISAFTDEKKLEVAVAMASLMEDERVAPEIKDFLQRKMPEVKLRGDFTPVVGNKALAHILSSISYSMTTSILDGLQKKDSSLANAVKNEMFLFDDIAKLDNKTMQEIIKVLDKERLAMALSRTSEEIKQKFLKNVTEKAAEMLKEDIETLQPAAKEGEEKKIAIFEDIVNLDSKTAQQIFKIIDKDTMKIALKGTSDEIRDKLYSMMTERAAAMLKEDIEVMPPVARSRAEEAHKKIMEEIDNLEKQPLAAQKEIIERILDLENAGRIAIKREA